MRTSPSRLAARSEGAASWVVLRATAESALGLVLCASLLAGIVEMASRAMQGPTRETRVRRIIGVSSGCPFDAIFLAYGLPRPGSFASLPGNRLGRTAAVTCICALLICAAKWRCG